VPHTYAEVRRALDREAKREAELLAELRQACQLDRGEAPPVAGQQ
jgi:hypothetical protein